MSKFSKLGAAALAMALSITLVAPISVNAEVITTYENGKDIAHFNEDSKKSISVKDGYTFYRAPYAIQNPLKTIKISTNSYGSSIDIRTSRDVAKFTDFKGNKKALKVKVMSKDETLDTSSAKTASLPDYKDKDGNYYYRNVNDEIVKVEKSRISADMPKGNESGTYKVRLFAKKAGNYKLTYNAVLKNGTTVKKTIKVIAVSDGYAIKSVTFAGKVLMSQEEDGINYGSDSYDKSEKLYTKGLGLNVSTAKSGKIRVTMNKDFKLKKIEVGTPVMKDDSKDGSVYIHLADQTSSIYDGSFSWKKVKNGKKIKLSKVDTSTIEYNKKSKVVEKKQAFTQTVIRITYYDKKGKTTERAYYNIFKVQK